MVGETGGEGRGGEEEMEGRMGRSYICTLNSMACALHIHVYAMTYRHVHVCLTLLASFFLPSHLSFKNMY